MQRDPLVPLLSAVRRRWRSSVLLRSCGRALACAAAAVLALFAFSVVRPLTGPWLAGGAFGLLLLAAAGTFYVWRAAGRRRSDAQIARFIEERAQQSQAGDGSVEPFADVLVSAVGRIDAASREARALEGFERLVVAAAARRLDEFGADRIVPGRELWRRGGEAFAGAAALAIAIAVASPMLSQMFEAGRLVLFPGTIEVDVLTGDARVAAGQPLKIRAVVRAGGDALSRVSPSLTVTDGTDERTVAMSPENGEFSFAFESIDRTFRYRVTAGPARSADYTVTALVPARVERIDLRYEYPAFTSQPPREQADGGDIYAPAGTRVRLRVHTDKPVAEGALALGTDDASLPLAPVGDNVLEGQIVLARDDSYRVGLTDRDGLRSADGTEYFIRLMSDRPPDVRILRPGGDVQITPLEEVAIEARADDDHGIDRFELVYAVAGREAAVVPLRNAAGTAQSKTASHVLAAEDLRVSPGDVISYYARARDVATGKRASETRSDMYFLEVRPFSEEFVLAQSQALNGVSGDQIEALIAAQKEIIAATWSVERRAASGAGRSAADISAIAAAQAELKARVDQIASSGRRGQRAMPYPQQIGPPRQGRGTGRNAGPDPVAAAASAMSRAVEQLNGARTNDALPHEMAALQGLLRAQAEVRRREVAQQAGAAGAGMGRQGQDLSALFDKELQRQQKTNYETRATTQSEAERPADSALEKIRDLARRQEELSRKQRELASAAPEERKRQLETLTREQEELRAQADALAKASAGGGEMRGAAEQMREAAGDLQRQDLESASQRGERAASRLRRLEQQMQQDSPESRQRAAGELRLEAQQIADEQRRIAGEADRLERSGAGGRADARGRSGDSGAEAWRRLAGEKDALAQRVDDLTRAAQRAAQGQKPGNGDGASAVLDLERQKMSAQMRDGAARMRGDRSDRGNSAEGRGAAPQPAAADGRAAAEAKIARALDEVVDRMGGEAGNGAAALTRELDRTRAIRDRLDGLSRQLREAESKQGAGAGAESAETQRLRGEYAKAMQQARRELDRLERGGGNSGVGGATPEAHEWSPTDQGTEPFKQDFTRWESLRREIDTGLDRYDQSLVARAAARALDDRLNAGGSDRVPDAYRALIARYYESLARKQ